MKQYKISGTILFGSIVAAVVIGCGGGGGGGSSAPTVQSTIDEAAIKTVAGRVVNNGMCTLVSGGMTNPGSAAGSSTGGNSSSQAGYSSGGSNSSANPFPAAGREYEFDNTYYGVLGGSMDVHTKHENGTTRYTYSMNAFENIYNGKDVTLDGEAEKIDHGKPSDYGPVVSNTTAQTNGAVAATVNDTSRGVGSAEHYSIELKGFNLVYSTELMQPNRLTVDAIKLTDTDKNKEYSVTNVKADAFGMADQLANLTAVYNDADVGTLQVTQESTMITISKEDGLGNIPLVTNMTGSVELEATDGTKGTLEIVGSNVKIYTKNANGQKTLVSELNCPVLTK